MRGAVQVAVAAATSRLLQGWDNATLAGAVLYIKKEFNLQNEPTIVGLIVAMSIIGATAITAVSGSLSDWFGRRLVLLISSFLYIVSGLVMLWSPNVYVLLFARLIQGFGVGLAVTLVPVYISETAPSEIRGELSTLPQLCNSVGMLLSYCMVFGLSLMDSPSWRFMLGVLSIPSLSYFTFMVFFLPESPRWLVSNGRMLEAKQVLQRLRGMEDVTGEMALLLEGLAVGGETRIEEYTISQGANDLSDTQEPNSEKGRQMRLYGPEEGVSWIAKPLSVIGQSSLGLGSRIGSSVNQSVQGLMDPLVTLFDSFHDHEAASMRSMFFRNLSGRFSTAEADKNEESDVESQRGDQEDSGVDSACAGIDYSDQDNFRSPLLSRETTGMEKDLVPPPPPSNYGSSVDVGGGWQLAWKWSEGINEDGKKEGGFKRIYMRQESNSTAIGSRRASIFDHIPSGGEFNQFQAAALVSQSALYSKDHRGQNQVGPAMVHPPQGPTWSDLFEPGIKHALFVGVGIQVLQQFSGMSGMLYYTPQILEQAGVGVLLSNMGISSDSASLLTSAITTFLMLPCIVFAMRLIDTVGRRSLLLRSSPVLIVSLMTLVLSNTIEMGMVAHAIISSMGVVVYVCSFGMGYGPIPSILCSEIFPTRVRGICIAICNLIGWMGTIIVSYTLPLMLNSFGLAGVCALYALFCIITWIFVFLKVPETKGMPLEVISDFFAVGAPK